MRKYRKLLFPIISKGIITGYNIYNERPKKTTPFLVNYLHSDLDFEKGKPKAHLEELLEVLSKFGPVYSRNNLVNSVVDRIAIYKIGDWEENPKGLRFYDKDGKRLSRKNLKTYRGLVVAEGKQCDLGIEIISRKDLNKVLGLFHKYTFAHKIDKKGRPIKEQDQICFNPHAIIGAWEIPLIIISAESMKRQDYLNIADLNISDKNHEISTITDKSLIDLEKELNSHKVPYLVSRKFCNRAFVELYINS